VTAPTPRLSGAERRKQLIEAAMDLFSRKGFGGTTTKEIAQAAGVSEAIIFRHFATKRDLYTAIIEHIYHSTGAQQAMAEIEDCMKRRDDEGFFRLLATKVIEGHRMDPRVEKLMTHARLEGHELAVYHREFGMPMLNTIRAYLDGRKRAGALRQIDSVAMILAMVGMSRQFALITEREDPIGLKLRDDQVVEAFTRIMMDGVRGPKGKKSK
jgi:TetR/AcrR family transcriptional regulator